MDLRYGINVPISSVPFHVPVSFKEGKFPLRDIRYYYVTARVPPVGMLKTKLFICHSGFFFSTRRGQCVPAFMHEYVLAGASYRLGVNLMQEANLNFVGMDFIGNTGIEMGRIAKITIGSTALETIQNPKMVFGVPVPLESLLFELATCYSSGYFSTPDYRIYYICVSKSNSQSITSNNNEPVDDNPVVTQGDDDDDDLDGDDFTQTAFGCPPGLFFSEFYGFCVSPYIHQFVGLNRLDRYLWGSHKIKDTEIPSEGLPWDESTVPWELPVCKKPGKFGVRDPRFYALCSADSSAQLIMCPTNLYFSAQRQTCVAVKECDCWYKIGYLANPFPLNAYGQELDIFIHLDRAYLNLLRQVLLPVIRRSSQAGRSDGKASALIKKLICFWREMEKYRTLDYQYTSPDHQRKKEMELAQQNQNAPPGVGPGPGKK